MIWNKPRNVWQWILLLSPAVAAVVASEIAKWSLPPIPPLRSVNGQIFPDVEAYVFRIAWIALEVTGAGSLVVALMLSRGAEIGERIAQVMFFTLCLGFSNCCVAFCGCAVLGVPNLRPDEMAPMPQSSGVVKSPTAP